MSLRVLICDDAMFMRNRIKEALDGSVYEVVGEAEDGEQAVQRYDELRPDVVTMDIVMPRMTGIEAVREIVGRHPGARVVICTAIGQEAYLGEAIRAGAQDYIIKPFKPSVVQEVLERVCS